MKGHDAIPDVEPTHHPAGWRHDPATFVIVLWLEPRGDEWEPEWRWRVREVGDDGEASFRRVADVLAYIAERSGTSGPG